MITVIPHRTYNWYVLLLCLHSIALGYVLGHSRQPEPTIIEERPPAGPCRGLQPHVERSEITPTRVEVF